MSDIGTKHGIPEEYRKLRKTLAADIVGVPRSSFYRKYLETGDISISQDTEGKEYITFDELVRVFGERAWQGLQVYIQNGINGRNGTEPIPFMDVRNSGEFSELEVENARLQERVQALQERLKDRDAWVSEREAQLRERQEVILEQKSKLNALEGRIFNLLEDKNTKEDSSFVRAQQEKISQLEQKIADVTQSITLQKKGFWARLFSN